MTNGFVKKTQRLPASELETAKRYRADYLSREKERKSYNTSEKSQARIGPQWRPKLDDLVAGASARKEIIDKDGRGSPKRKISQQSR